MVEQRLDPVLTASGVEKADMAIAVREVLIFKLI